MSSRIPGRRVTAALLGAIAASGLCWAAMSTSASASSTTTIRLAYNPNPTNTTIVVAQQQGFFAKNGLNVKLTASNNTALLVPAIGKQFDIVTVTPPSLLQAAASGLNPMLVGGETYESPNERDTYFIGAKGVTSLKDLVGKTVGVVGLSGSLYTSAVIVLQKAGVQPTQVHFLSVPFADMFNDLQSGTIQAAVTIFPFQGQMLGAGGVDLGNPVLQATGSKLMLDAGWVSYRPWAVAHRKALAEFETAQHEALHWMTKNLAATRQILVSQFQIPTFVAAKYPVTEGVAFGISPSNLAPWVKPMQNAGLLKKSFKASSVKHLVLTGRGS
jgi:NitT/TauT family transport system substrate-binding protein